MSKNPFLFVAAAVMFVLSMISIGACMAALVSSDSPARTCVDWDTHKVRKTVTPKPERTYDRNQQRWENGRTPEPYPTTVKVRYCDEWESASPAPTDS